MRDRTTPHWSTATSVNVGATTNGEIEFSADLYWFSFNAVADGQYVISTNSDVALDTVIRVYATNGTAELAYDNDSGDGRSSLIDWTASASGAYFIRVQENGYNATGTYQLTFAGVAGGDDHGNTLATASALTVTTSGNGPGASGNIDFPDDIDFFSFSTGWGSGNLNSDDLINSTDLGLLLNNFRFRSKN